MLQKAGAREKAKYENRRRLVEQASFTPLVFSSMSGASKLTATCIMKLASLLSENNDMSYNTTICWIQCRLAFALPSCVCVAPGLANVIISILIMCSPSVQRAAFISRSLYTNCLELYVGALLFDFAVMCTIGLLSNIPWCKVVVVYILPH